MTGGRIEYTELDWRWAILLGAAIRDGLIEAVADRALPAEAVARDLCMDARAVGVVLAALAELGVLEEGREGFRLLEEHRGPLLAQDHPDYVGQSVVHRFELIGSWGRMPEILRTGRPVEDRTLPGFGGTETFIAAMRRGARPGAGAVADAVLARLPEGASILDVGGGPGTNAEAFAVGGARVTVFDRPEVVGLMRESLAASGIETASGDMNEGLPEGLFGAVYFGHTSHMYGPKENRALFARMRRSLAPDGMLVVREYVRGLGEDAALFAANMLVLTPRGGTYTAEEYERWLLGAGYDAIEYEPVAGRSSHLIFARRAG
ncbi:MAG TPA: class I SAM-dependent methyltransferase [Rubrobacter sp.]|nr:class I SAM-dependent methyltransferase [Rubrobacter sp.]